METFLKIAGVLIVPILLVFLNNRLAKLKHDREIKAEFLKLAEDFENKGIDSRSTLYKDRLAKSLFNNDALTYSEAKFFSSYENADLWVKEYAKIRGFLRRERDETGVITGFRPKYNWIKISLAFTGYSAFTFIGLIPFYKFNEYIAKIIIYYEKGVLLNILITTVPFGMCLVAGFLCLKYIEKCADCGIFLHDFKKDAFKVVEAEKTSEEGIAA